MLANVTLADELRRALDRENIFRLNGLDPSPFQKEILNAEDRFWLVACGRQTGKSTGLGGLVSHTALCFPDSNIVLAAPSERQVKELLRVVRSLIRGAGYSNEIQSEAQTLLEFKNNSRILGVPGGRSDNVRGFSNITLAAIDEAAYCPDDLFVAIQPMLAVNPRSKFFALSSPCGVNNWFGRTWHADNHYRKVRVRSDECERIPKDFLEQMSKELGALYAQEFEADFLTNETQLLDAAFLTGKFQSFGIF